MALVEAHTQIPLYPPLFKGGSFVPGLYPSLEKWGRGDFWAESGWNYIANFWVTTLAGHRINGAKIAEPIFVGLFTFVVFLCHSSSVALEGGD